MPEFLAADFTVVFDEIDKYLSALAFAECSVLTLSAFNGRETRSHFPTIACIDSDICKFFKSDCVSLFAGSCLANVKISSRC